MNGPKEQSFFEGYVSVRRKLGKAQICYRVGAVRRYNPTNAFT